MTIRFQIPESLLPRLRQLQSESVYPDDVMKSEDAVVMMSGFGPAMYLTMDGRVIVHHYMDDEPPREASDKKEAYSAIVIGAKLRKTSELLSLLPARTVGAKDCQSCGGNGWLALGESTKGEAVTIVCHGCGGLGWSDDSEQAQAHEISTGNF
jgi:hypothetical protein